MPPQLARRRVAFHIVVMLSAVQRPAELVLVPRRWSAAALLEHRLVVVDQDRLDTHQVCGDLGEAPGRHAGSGSRPSPGRPWPSTASRHGRPAPAAPRPAWCGRQRYGRDPRSHRGLAIGSPARSVQRSPTPPRQAPWTSVRMSVRASSAGLVGVADGLLAPLRHPGQVLKPLLLQCGRTPASHPRPWSCGRLA